MRLLPNALTLLQVGCGFLELAALLRDRSDMVPSLLCAALLADGLAGRLARGAGWRSDLGAELDALAGLSAFALGPLAYAFEICLRNLGCWGGAVALIGAVAAALRLSRDNAASPDWPRYQGLPLAAFGSAVGLSCAAGFSALPTAAVILLGSAAMLSPWRWRRFDACGWAGALAAALLILAVVWPAPRGLVLFFTALYALGGAWTGFGGALADPESLPR